MKKTIEPPSIESMKLHIELDEEMEEQWSYIKKDLEHVFEHVYEKSTHITNKIVLKCLFYCYEEGSLDAYPISFVGGLSIEELKLLSQTDI